MNLIMQYVQVWWDKKYRGGAGATHRNSIPGESILPEEIVKYRGESGKAFVHKLFFSHQNGLSAPVVNELKVMNLTDLRSIGCFSFRVHDSTLKVTYNWYDGAPERKRYNSRKDRWEPLKEEAFALSVNELGKGEYNRRFSDDSDGEWLYEKLTMNVCLTEKFERGLFLGAAYNAHYQQMADLW